MNEQPPGVDGPCASPLSGFEARCLCRRTCECEALLQLAVLGIEQAQARHDPSDALDEIAELLREAEDAVERAHRLAAQLSR